MITLSLAIILAIDKVAIFLLSVNYQSDILNGGLVSRLNGNLGCTLITIVQSIVKRN